LQGRIADLIRHAHGFFRANAECVELVGPKVRMSNAVKRGAFEDEVLERAGQPEHFREILGGFGIPRQQDADGTSFTIERPAPRKLLLGRQLCSQQKRMRVVRFGGGIGVTAGGNPGRFDKRIDRLRLRPPAFKMSG
jgi:hypothetical protein